MVGRAIQPVFPEHRELPDRRARLPSMTSVADGLAGLSRLEPPGRFPRVRVGRGRVADNGSTMRFGVSRVTADRPYCGAVCPRCALVCIPADGSAQAISPPAFLTPSRHAPDRHDALSSDLGPTLPPKPAARKEARRARSLAQEVAARGHDRRRSDRVRLPSIASAIDGVYSTARTARATSTLTDPTGVRLSHSWAVRALRSATTWPVESGQAAWITWTRTESASRTSARSWQYRQRQQQLLARELRALRQERDDITYYVHANRNGTNQKTTGRSASRSPTGAPSATSRATSTFEQRRADAHGRGPELTPKMRIAFRRPRSTASSSRRTARTEHHRLDELHGHRTRPTSRSPQARSSSRSRKALTGRSSTSPTATLIAKSTTRRRSASPVAHERRTAVCQRSALFYSPTVKEVLKARLERYAAFDQRSRDVNTIYDQYLITATRRYLAVPFLNEQRRLRHLPQLDVLLGLQHSRRISRTCTGYALRRGPGRDARLLLHLRADAEGRRPALHRHHGQPALPPEVVLRAALMQANSGTVGPSSDAKDRQHGHVRHRERGDDRSVER